MLATVWTAYVRWLRTLISTDTISGSETMRLAMIQFLGFDLEPDQSSDTDGRTLPYLVLSEICDAHNMHSVLRKNQPRVSR